jgi:hypothetical protein
MNAQKTTARTMTTEPKSPAIIAWLTSAVNPMFSKNSTNGPLEYHADTPITNPANQNDMRIVFLPNFLSSDDTWHPSAKSGHDSIASLRSRNF